MAIKKSTKAALANKAINKASDAIDDHAVGAKNKIISETKKLILAALSMVAALAWNSAFQHLFQDYKILKKGGPWVYAVAVTLICVIVLYFIEKV